MDKLTIQVSGTAKNMKAIFRMLDMYRKRGRIEIEEIDTNVLVKTKKVVKPVEKVTEPVKKVTPKKAKK